MTNPNAFETAPVTLYQFFLVNRCGATLYREGAEGCYTLEGDFSYADEDAAEAFENAALPEHGPKAEPVATGGFAIYPCSWCDSRMCNHRTGAACRAASMA